MFKTQLKFTRLLRKKMLDKLHKEFISSNDQGTLRDLRGSNLVFSNCPGKHLDYVHQLPTHLIDLHIRKYGVN